MRNKTFIITLAAVLLVLFCLAPVTNAFIGVAALGAIIAVTFASSVLLDEAEKHHKTANEKRHEEAAAESRSLARREPVALKTVNPARK